MKKIILILILVTSTLSVYSQDEVYSYIEKDVINRIIIDENYFVMTSYKVNSNEFVKTVGGFYEKKGKKYNVELEFNSDFKKDSLSYVWGDYYFLNSMYEKSILKYKTTEDNLSIVEINKNSDWKKISLKENDLQGKWLMVGRVRNGKEQRRNLERPRKTMKFLINGYFQWIAFNTETFQFSGSGGGKYSTKEGTYTENIEYFSRDDSRVGATLKFDYKLKNEEWNHIGFSSKGDPMHEIWVKRK